MAIPRRTKYRIVSSLSVIAPLASLACSGDPQDLSLRDSKPEAPKEVAWDDAAEAKRVKEMQKVSVTQKYSCPDGSKHNDTVEVVAGMVPFPPGCDVEETYWYKNFASRPGWIQRLGAADYLSCQVEQQLNTVAATRPPIIFQMVGTIGGETCPGVTTDPTVTIEIPVLPMASRVAVFNDILARARAAENLYNQEWKEVFGDSTIRSSLSSERLRMISGSYARSLAQRDELFERAVEAIVDISDAQRSSTLSVELAAKRSLAAPELSRMHAAHLLVGGSPGQDDELHAPPALSPAGAQALSILRAAAPDPSDIRSGYGTDVLIDSMGTLTQGSVKERLADIYDQSYPGSVEEKTGLRLRDFQEARNYLIGEIDTFSRSRRWQLPATRKANGSMSTFRRYAGVAFPPFERPAAYWAARAKYTVATDPAGYNNLRETSLAGSIFLQLKEAAVNLRNYVYTIPANLQNDGLTPLWQVFEAKSAKYISTIAAGTTNYMISDYYGGDLDYTGWRVVVGEDALSCAVDGVVEGIPCTLAQLNKEFTTFSETEPGMTLCWFGWPSNRTLCKKVDGGTTDSAAVLAAQAGRTYLVRPKNTRAAPGDFEVMTGIPRRGIFDTTSYRLWAISPYLDNKAGEILAVDKNAYTQSELTCAGTHFNERMPLENELASTADGIESSWRYYLDRAKQAAHDADELGVSYINASLDSAVRKETVEERQIRREQEAEDAMANLQDVCGTNADPLELLKLLSGATSDDDLSTLRQTDVSGGGADCDGAKPCAAGYSCVVNMCLKRPADLLKEVTDAGMSETLARLQECIGDDVEHDFVTLGDKPICLWHAKGAPSQLCEAADKEHECPTVAPAGADCYSTSDTNKLPTSSTELVPVRVTAALKYFETPVPQESPETICDQIEHLHDASWPSTGDIDAQRKAALDAIVKSDMFHPWNLVELAPRVGWRAIPGGRSAITIDNQDVFTTAKCASVAGDPTCDSLIDLGFCPNNCLTDADRAVANNRMFQAVFALRASTVNTMDKVYVPFYVRKYEGSIAGAAVVEPYPGVTTYTPMKATPVDAGEDGCRWPDQKSGFTVYQTDSTATLPAIWKQPASGGTTQDFGVVRGTGDQTYRFAIGNIASGVPVGFDGCSKDVRSLTMWNGMSTANVIGTLGERIAASIAPSIDYLQGLPGVLAAGAGYAQGPIYKGLKAPATGVFVLPQKYALHMPRISPKGQGFNVLDALLDYGPGEAVRLAGKASSYVPGLSIAVKPFGNAGNDLLAWALDSQTGDLQTAISAGEKFMEGDILGGLECACSSIPIIGDAICDCPSTPPPPPPLRYWADPIVSFENKVDNYVDAAQVACKIWRYAEDYACDPNHPPEVNSVRDLERVKKFMGCVATEIEGDAGRMVLAHFPVRAERRLIDETVLGAFPTVGGQVGEATSRLRGALNQSQQMIKDIGAEVRALGDNLDELRIREDLKDVQDKIADVQFRSKVANYIAECGKAISDIPTIDLPKIAGKAAGAAITCANSVAQTAFAAELKGYEEDANSLNLQLAFNDFQTRLNGHAQRMGQLKSDLITQLEEVNVQLATIERLRGVARDTLARAIHKASAMAKSEATVSMVYSNRAAVSEERYRRAHRNAVKLAFLAKRAIELRLGINLSEMHDDLPLVPAPASWEGTACTSTGINYAALEKPANGTGEESFNPGQFADQFIGDYVTKLENLVESYRLEYGFHEGQDTSVISLRDDMFNVRAPCKQPSGNQLYFSSQLDSYSYDAASENGWRIEGCKSSGTSLTPDCVSIAALSSVAGSAINPFNSNDPTVVNNLPYRVNPNLETAEAYRIALGHQNGDACTTANPCGYQSGAALVQHVTLLPGSYALSWYYAPDSGFTSSNGFEVVDVVNNSDGSAIATTSLPKDDDTGMVAWSRFTKTFSVDKTTAVKVRVGASASVPRFGIAALMLEPVSAGQAPIPSIYEGTTGTLTHSTPVCVDRDGTVFRAEKWRRGCLSLCNTGYGSTCDSNTSLKQCYHEATFPVSQWFLESGRSTANAGFASGNFNYRIESIGLNFVGTGIVNCANSATPEACHANGNIQYSMIHSGPYTVRNHMGQDYSAALFQGNIEHARGLAAERYITNPISSTDDTLLHEYMRGEFQGRPLDGNYVIRVWDNANVDFERIKDIQVVLKYRYWTRFD